MKTKKILIDNELCSKCGRCVKKCPVNILSQENKTSVIQIGDTTQCTLCGICIKTCRKHAIAVNGVHLCRKSVNEWVRTSGFAISLILFPIMLLVGFLMHPNLLQMKMVVSAQDLVERFHHNIYFHIGHLIVMFAVPLIIVSMIGIMNMLHNKGKSWGYWGCIIGVFGAFILAVDKGALCLVLSAFDTLSENDFAKVVPYLQVIVDKAGLLKVCLLLPLLPMGAVIQAVGIIKEKIIKKWQGIILIIGLLLLNNPDIEVISSIGSILMCFGYFPIARKILQTSSLHAKR